MISPCCGKSTAKAAKRLSDISKAVKEADTLILATDPGSRGRSDLVARAGNSEATRKVLKDKRIERVVFNAITKQRHHSMRWPSIRARSMQALVDAYLARRALDYLVGFNAVARICGVKLPGARSAGRVQSVALRLVCERETGNRKVRGKREYWSLVAHLLTAGQGEPFLGAARRRRRAQDHPSRYRRRRRDAHAFKAALEHGDIPRLRPSRPNRRKRNPYAAFHHLDVAAGGFAQSSALAPARTMQTGATPL